MASISTPHRYRFISRLGAGGTSSVVLAEDTLLGRRVALKRVHAPDDATARSRLRREAVIGASLSHPNLVSIYDIVTTDGGEEVIVMEHIEGETLGARLRRGEKPDASTALRILDGVAAALDAIHAHGIVHRDVKPGNVLLGSDGSVKLADLGIAAVSDGTHITTSGSVLGTFSYMAPEQLESAPATSAVDVYALAALAFEALSGEKARHERNAVALAHAIATQPPPDLRTAWPQAPAAAAELLIQGMAHDPAARPRSASELTKKLRAALESRPSAAAALIPRALPAARRPTPAPVTVVGGRRRSRGGVLAMAATLLAALAVAGIVVSSLGGTRQKRTASLSGAHQQLAAQATQRSTRGRTHTRTAAQVRHSTRSSVRHAKPNVSSVSPQPVAPVSPSPAQPTPQASPAPVTAPSTASPAPVTGPVTTSPIDAVESFYHLAASHDYAAAWAMTDPSFRQELEGYEGLQATMAAERSIIFNGASVLDESASNAIVSVRTTSMRETGTQSCSGTVNLLRAGSSSSGWVLDHIAISCV